MGFTSLQNVAVNAGVSRPQFQLFLFNLLYYLPIVFFQLTLNIKRPVGGAPVASYYASQLSATRHPRFHTFVSNESKEHKKLTAETSLGTKGARFGSLVLFIIVADNIAEFQAEVEYVKDKWITFMVWSRLVSAAEYHFKDI